MSIALFDKDLDTGNRIRRLSDVVRDVTDKALRRSVIYTPGKREELDIELANLLAEANGQAETKKTPRKLTKEIGITAHTLIELWQPEDYNTGTVVTLGRAADITGDDELIEFAADLVEQNPEIVGIVPVFADVLHDAMGSPDTSFTDTLVAAPYMRVPDPDKSNGSNPDHLSSEQPVPQVDPAEYEWL